MKNKDVKMGTFKLDHKSKAIAQKAKDLNILFLMTFFLLT